MRPPVLDVCCGPRSMWADPANPAALFGDRRRERRVVTDRSHGKTDGQRVLRIEPDVQFDFCALPFSDGSFRLVAFDPPHLVRGGKNGWMVSKYGKLSSGWRDDIRAGFQECWRVLEDGGVLIFKWNETHVSVREVMPLYPAPPLFGHRSGHKRLTHWMVFMKPASDHNREI